MSDVNDDTGPATVATGGPSPPRAGELPSATTTATTSTTSTTSTTTNIPTAPGSSLSITVTRVHVAPPAPPTPTNTPNTPLDPPVDPAVPLSPGGALRARNRAVTLAAAGRWGAPATRAAFDTAAEGRSLYAELRVIGPFTWLHFTDDYTPPSPVRFFWDGAALVRPGTVINTFRVLLSGALPDLARDRDDILAVFDEVCGDVVRTDAHARALLAEPHWGKAASADAVALIEPPHFEGADLVFCANGHNLAGNGWDWQLACIRVDAETLGVSVELLGPGQEPTMLIGRAYASDAGNIAVRFAPSTKSAATRWRRAAAGEHASIASFARAALELMAVGAPLDLVSRTHVAAVDEVRHTERSLAIATRIDGENPEPGALPALPPRPGDRGDVARRTLLEAAVPETLAAADARAAADRCVVDDVRAILSGIADDEARHAQLAWDIVAWANDGAGGAIDDIDDDDLVAAADDGAVIDVDDDDDDDVWGLLGAVTRAQVRARAMDEVRERLARQRSASRLA